MSLSWRRYPTAPARRPHDASTTRPIASEEGVRAFHDKQYAKAEQKLPGTKEIQRGGAVGQSRSEFDRLLGEARALAAHKHLSEAGLTLTRAEDLNVDNARVHAEAKSIAIQEVSAEISSALGAGDWTEARAQVDRLAQLDPSNPLIEQGRTQIARGRAEAERKFHSSKVSFEILPSTRSCANFRRRA